MNMKRYTSACLAFLLGIFFSSQAVAESVTMGNASLTVPDGWETAKSNFSKTVPDTVRNVLDCLDEKPSQLKNVGWKFDESGVVQAAYCVSYQKSGMGRARNIVKTAKGKDKEKVHTKFIDTFAGTIHSGYAKRKMKVTGMSGDLIEAGDDILLVFDGNVTGGGKDFIRAGTFFLHGDSLVSVNFIHDLSAPKETVQQLDGITQSVNLK